MTHPLLRELPRLLVLRVADQLHDPTLVRRKASDLADDRADMLYSRDDKVSAPRGQDFEHAKTNLGALGGAADTVGRPGGLGPQAGLVTLVDANRQTCNADGTNDVSFQSSRRRLVRSMPDASLPPSTLASPSLVIPPIAAFPANAPAESASLPVRSLTAMAAGLM